MHRRPFGVTAGQVNILVTFAALAAPHQAEVARALYMEKSTLSRSVERLQRNRWLGGPGGSHRSISAAARRGRAAAERQAASRSG